MYFSNAIMLKISHILLSFYYGLCQISIKFEKNRKEIELRLYLVLQKN